MNVATGTFSDISTLKRVKTSILTVSTPEASLIHRLCNDIHIALQCAPLCTSPLWVHAALWKASKG